MTAGELIEKLKKVDGGKRVYVSVEFGYCDILEIDEEKDQVELIWS
ncbi:hypothetical protein KAR91_62505 [Candidatus Pacearchaeota archaeon]|nr:hypothetical protein [Candidatus Pacearchaeota archaeon]